ncbi:hypothetical protein U9M48_002494 [Paspalum notatum var. saurae]|uniref:Uncharacterized protein n=1 Tax=Paspalum notatum var. saurae TaxID=547442 RepID=A0AAQ3PJW7_PASNO
MTTKKKGLYYSGIVPEEIDCDAPASQRAPPDGFPPAGFGTGRRWVPPFFSLRTLGPWTTSLSFSPRAHSVNRRSTGPRPPFPHRPPPPLRDAHAAAAACPRRAWPRRPTPRPAPRPHLDGTPAGCVPPLLHSPPHSSSYRSTERALTPSVSHRRPPLELPRRAHPAAASGRLLPMNKFRTLHPIGVLSNSAPRLVK